MKSLAITRRFSVAFLLAIGAAFALAVTPRVAAQTFPASPASMKDFSDSMLETPNTAMSIQANEPLFSAQEPSDDEVVSPDPSYTPPQSPYSPDIPETNTDYEGPVGMTGIFNGNVATACSYDPLSHSAHRSIDDMVVPGSIGKYPLKMTRYYNSRAQYYALSAIGLSPGWSHEYSWLVWANGHKVVSPHGNVSDDTCGPPEGVSEYWESHPAEGTGTWRLADGGKVVFNGDGDHSFKVTDIYDPYGQRTRIAYDANGQRVKVTEPGGRCLWFIYGTRNQGPGWGDGTWLITRVEAYDADGSPGAPVHPTGDLIDWVNYTYQVYDPWDPNNPGNRRQKMLTQVDYSDGTSATYDYRTDNVHEGLTSHKMYPVLKRADDVRYHGPMRAVVYVYQGSGPHGAILAENCPGIGPVSAISPGIPTGGNGSQDTFTETRGDGPSRTFNYTHLRHCTNNPECGVCDDYSDNDPPQQMLQDYTDFQGHTIQLGYDANWYVNSVTDANNHTTTYLHGARPPNGIGEITKITHPDGTYIQYQYDDHGHYINSIRDENGNVTTLHRDGNHRIYQIDYPTNANTPASYEGFAYNGFGQVTYHLLRNGAWETYVYDSRGLLTDKYEPKFGSPPGGMTRTPTTTIIGRMMWT